MTKKNNAGNTRASVKGTYQEILVNAQEQFKINFIREYKQIRFEN